MYYIFITDIHGMADDLLRAIKRANDFMDACGTGYNRKFVFGGDYIDRGTDHSKVINIIRNHALVSDAMVLCGNHDMMLIGTAEDLIFIGDNGRHYPYWQVWDENDGLNTAIDMFGDIGASSTKDYVDIIKSSDEYLFLKQYAKLYFETENIFFSHAPQSKLDGDETALIWGRSKDYSNQKGDSAFLVPNNKIMSIHGHVHHLHKKVNFPRIHHYTHGGINKTVILADAGCGCSIEGKLHPVVLFDNGIDRPELIAIL